MKWTLETRKLGEIHENSINPRRLSTESAGHLRKSIERFGVCEPLVINRDGLIIGGHQRFKTLQGMGIQEIPVYVPDRILTEEEVAELTIRLNKAVGEWDYDVLANGWDIDFLVEWGFSLEELGLGDPPPEEEKPYKATVTVSVVDSKTLECVEREVCKIAQDYMNVTYKVRVK